VTHNRASDLELFLVFQEIRDRFGGTRNVLIAECDRGRSIEQIFGHRHSHALEREFDQRVLDHVQPRFFTAQGVAEFCQFRCGQAAIISEDERLCLFQVLTELCDQFLFAFSCDGQVNSPPYKKKSLCQ
jgi:hypothetical protein